MSQVQWEKPNINAVLTSKVHCNICIMFFQNSKCFVMLLLLWSIQKPETLMVPYSMLCSPQINLIESPWLPLGIITYLDSNQSFTDTIKKLSMNIFIWIAISPSHIYYPSEEIKTYGTARSFMPYQTYSKHWFYSWSQESMFIQTRQRLRTLFCYETHEFFN